MSEEYASDMSGFATANPEKVKRFEQFVGSLKYSLKRVHPSKIVLFLVCLSVTVNFVRPQDLPGLGFIGAIRLPIMVAFVTAVFWFPHAQKNISKPIKLVLALLGIQAIRGLLGAVDPTDSIIRNNSAHFFSFRNMAIQMIGLHLPIVACLACKQGLRVLSSVLVCIGLFLAFWGLAHAGTGPGGFVLDENDLCYALLNLMPFSVLYMATSNSSFVRMFNLLAFAAMFAGVVSTVSRGGMLGFAALGVFLFLRSDKKPLFILIGLVGAIVAIPILPDKFKDELFSIQKDVGGHSGTVKKRTDMWNITWIAFKDPKHTPFGVGMRNIGRWIPDYDPEAGSASAGQKWGRAVHSLYFQIMGDLGAAGLILIGLSVWTVFRSNMLIERRFKKALRALKYFGKERRIALHRDYGVSPDEINSLLKTLMKEGIYVCKFAVALNTALVGGMAAAVGISVLYYPVMWMVIAISVAFSFYAKNLLDRIEQLYGFIEGKAATGYS